MVFTFCQTGSEWLVRFFLVRKCFGSFFLVRNCFGSEKNGSFFWFGNADKFGSEIMLVQRSTMHFGFRFQYSPCSSIIHQREAARGLGGCKRPRRPQEASEAARGLGGCKRPRRLQEASDM